MRRMYVRSQTHPALEARIRLALGLCGLSLLAVLLLRMLLPWLMFGSFLAAAYWGWQQWQSRERQQKQTLNQAFYQLLKTQNGRLTVLDLAIQTHLSGPIVKAYLDDQARAFSAQFEPLMDGDILYVFSLGQQSSISLLP